MISYPSGFAIEPGRRILGRRPSPIAKGLPERIARKTVRVNHEKFARLRVLVGADTEAEAIRQVIDEALAYSEALAVARRVQKQGAFSREDDPLPGASP